jgi:hypothetical protein
MDFIVCHKHEHELDLSKATPFFLWKCFVFLSPTINLSLGGPHIVQLGLFQTYFVMENILIIFQTDESND